jgi:hypothetical protein
MPRAVTQELDHRILAPVGSGEGDMTALRLKNAFESAFVYQGGDAEPRPRSDNGGGCVGPWVALSERAEIRWSEM